MEKEPSKEKLHQRCQQQHREVVAIAAFISGAEISFVMPLWKDRKVDADLIACVNCYNNVKKPTSTEYNKVADAFMLIIGLLNLYLPGNCCEKC